jgi:ligand-binding sensor domain-containing protein
MRKTLLLIIFQIIATNAITAQTQTPKWETLVDQNTPHCVVVRDSLVYIASDNGLTIRNLAGKIVNNFPNVNGFPQPVRELTFDANGTLYMIGMNSVIHTFDGKNWATPYPSFKEPFSSAQALGTDQKGRILLQYYKRKLICIAKGNEERDSLPFGQDYEKTNTLIEDKNGRLWCGSDWGLYYREKGKWTKMPDVTPVNEAVEHPQTKDIWFAHEGGGVSCWNGTTLKKYTTNQGLAHNDVPGITVDKNGNLWILTEKGVQEWDKNWKLLAQFNKANGYDLDNSRGNITADKQGNIWVCGRIGLHRFDGQTWTSLFTDGAISYLKSYLSDSKGRLWLGGSVERMACKEANRWTYTKFNIPPSRLLIPLVTGIVETNDGKVWASTAQGLFSYENSDWKPVLPYATEMISALVKAPNGSIYMSTQSGISCYKGGNWQKTNAEHGNVEALLPARNGDLWYAAPFGKGLVRVLKNGTVERIFEGENALPNEWVYCLHEDEKGNIWVGTQRGYAVFDGQTWKATKLYKEILSIGQSADGAIWMGTRREGVYKKVGDKLESYMPEGLPKDFGISASQIRPYKNGISFTFETSLYFLTY